MFSVVPKPIYVLTQRKALLTMLYEELIDISTDMGLYVTQTFL
jgi:hypothetical protein